MSNEDGQEPSIYAQSLASGKTTAGRLPCDRGVTFAWRARARKEARTASAAAFAPSTGLRPQRDRAAPHAPSSGLGQRVPEPLHAEKTLARRLASHYRIVIVTVDRPARRLAAADALAARGRPGVTLRRTLPARRGGHRGTDCASRDGSCPSSALETRIHSASLARRASAQLSREGEQPRSLRRRSQSWRFEDRPLEPSGFCAIRWLA